MQQLSAHSNRGLAQRHCAPRCVPFTPAPHQIAFRRPVVQARAGKLGDVSLFGASTSSLLGSTTPAMKDQDTGSKLDEVPLTSEVGRVVNSMGFQSCVKRCTPNSIDRGSGSGVQCLCTMVVCVSSCASELAGQCFFGWEKDVTRTVYLGTVDLCLAEQELMHIA